MKKYFDTNADINLALLQIIYTPVEPRLPTYSNTAIQQDG